MKKLFLCAFLILSFSFLLTSCHCKKKTAASQNNPSEVMRNFSEEGYTKAVVINYEIDGCNYLLQIAEQKKLEPTNLPQEFKKDKLDVWIKYVPKKGGMSICMAGQMIDITDIQLRK